MAFVRKKTVIADILQALAHGEQSSLNILNHIRLMTGRRYSIGRLYVTLHELERSGQITAHWGNERPPERGGCRRRYYGLAQHTAGQTYA